ncbi:hypothetical protein ACOTDZ_31205, partial [Achromobacter dolens]|uniref:hypothetical protein n=1 Tax=Achromobacter dolens TaxID=1287738 RepID=UPI003B9DCCF8
SSPMHPMLRTVMRTSLDRFAPAMFIPYCTNISLLNKRNSSGGMTVNAGLPPGACLPSQRY